MGKFRIVLAEVPKYLKNNYHPDQVVLYSSFTELTFKALSLPCVAEFLEKLAETLNLEHVKVVVMRLPAARTKVEVIQEAGKPHIIMEELKGWSKKKTPTIGVHPDLFWPSRLMKPLWSPAIRGFILNSTLRVVIHEMLHQSGVHDEAEARSLADQHYKEFRRAHLNRFEEEFKPILKEWKKTEKEIGLR